MTRPTARVLALLEILQSGGIHTVGRLAERLEIDERTVRRYAAHLVDLGIPVRSERGRYGGYRLAAGYRMPPLMLSDDEAVAVLLGLITGRHSGLVAASVAATESATAKLRRVLPDALAPRLAALIETVEFTRGGYNAAVPESGVLLTISEAVRERRAVAMTYTNTTGEVVDRTLRPYGVVAHSGRWYVIGDDSATKTTRVFRLDRMSSPKLLDGTFDIPDGFDAADEVVSTLARAPYRYEVHLRVEGPIDDVRQRLPPVVAMVDEGDQGWVRVRINAERLDWVPAVLARLGMPFVIDQPDALRVLVRELAAQLNAAARDPREAGDLDNGPM